MQGTGISTTTGTGRERPALAEARSTLRLTLDRVAEEFGKADFQTISGWEKGRGGVNRPSRERLKSYCLWLRSEAVRRGLDPASFEPWALCPIEFPIPVEEVAA